MKAPQSLSRAVEVEALSYRYGERKALDGISFSVASGTLFGLVGPNGGGKSTTFKLLSTLLPLQDGSVRMFGCDLRKDPSAVRRQIGVLFQSPALDKKLTAFENLKFQGFLYGLRGALLRDRADNLLKALGLFSRRSERVETFSGGMKRRLEIGKGLLHRPPLLLLDEPTTGLDPVARREVWALLDEMREKEGLTVCLTTHLLEEADRCHQVAFLHQGRIVASDSPAALKERLGGDVIALRSAQPELLKQKIQGKFALEGAVVDGTLRLEKRRGHEFIPELIAAFPDDIEAVTLGKPTLEDFFIQQTGNTYLASSLPRELS